MRVSGLVVTKDRPRFTDWWIWNVTKQTRIVDQLVVVDSTLYQNQEALVRFDVSLRDRLRGVVPEVEILHCPNAYVTGEARQVALEHAQGDVVVWFDDDDWYHPEKVERLTAGFEDGSVQNMAFMSTPWHLDVAQELMVEVDSLTYSCLIGMCAVRTDLGCLFQFEPVKLFEDTHWMAAVRGRLEQQHRKVDHLRSLKMPALILIHGKNTFVDGYRTGIQVYAEIGGIPFGEFENPDAVNPAEWAELTRRLEAMKNAAVSGS